MNGLTISLLQPISIPGGNWTRPSAGIPAHWPLMLGLHSSPLSPSQVGNPDLKTFIFPVRLNPLEHMRSLRIDNTADLSAPALFLLLQRATNLEEVIGTETWQELDLRTCADLTDLFDRHHLPHR